MSFYVYQLIKPLTLPNTSTSLSAISHQSSAISHQLQAISYQLAYQLSTIFTEQSQSFLRISSLKRYEAIASHFLSAFLCFFISIYNMNMNNQFHCLRTLSYWSLLMWLFLQQKIVMRVQMRCQKCRTKALKVVASANGSCRKIR